MEVEIKNVPPSPHTSMTPTKIFNPLDRDFTWTWNGQPLTIPAKQTALFPEFQAYHLAKHLAREIVYKNHAVDTRIQEEKMREKGGWGVVVPADRLSAMEYYLLNPTGVCPEPLKAEANKIGEAKGDTIGANLPVNSPYSEMKWEELRKVAVEKGVFSTKLNKVEVIEKLIALDK
jgi:hypothetical protein